MKLITKDKKLKRNWLLNLIPFFIISIYLFFAIFKINYPGIQYDEILFGNASFSSMKDLFGNTNNLFIEYSLNGFPILLMKYIGALKAYIYYPIFKIFGVSAFSIRLPMIFLIAFSLYIFYKTMKTAFNEKIALLSLFLLTFDASFILQSRYDVGPTSIEIFLKITALYFFYQFLKNKKNKYVIFTGIVLFLGMFNKLNFIWFVNSFIFSAILIYWENIKAIYLKGTTKFRIFLLAETFTIYFSCLIYFLLLNKIFNLFDPLKLSELPSRFVNVFNNFRSLIDGTGFFNYAFGDMNSVINKIYFLIIIFVILFGFIIYLIKYKSIKFIYKKEYNFFLLLLLTTLAQIIFTKRALAIWHAFTIYPFITIIITLSIIIIWKTIPNRKVGLVFLAILLTFICAYQIFLVSIYSKVYSRPTKNIFWSNKVTDLIKYAKKNTKNFISIDWGINTQLITFDRTNNKYIELFWALNDAGSQKTEDWLVKTIFSNEKTLYIMHPENMSIYPEARGNFFKLAVKYDYKVELKKSISDNDKLIFEIYSLKKQE